MRGLSKTRRFGRTLRLVGAGISGFALGFYWGYEDAPDCEATGFSDQLNQKDLWSAVGRQLMAANSFKFARDPKTLAITKIETRGDHPISLRSAWLAINSLLHSRIEGLKPNNFVISDDVRDSLSSNTSARDPLKLIPGWLGLANLTASIMSKRYQESHLYWQLTRAILEQRFWVKEGDQLWRPTDDPFIEALVDDFYFTEWISGKAKKFPSADQMKAWYSK